MLFKGFVFEFEVVLWKDGKLLRRIEKNVRNYSNRVVREIIGYDYGYMIFKYLFLIRYDINKIIMISGKIGELIFDVGWYKM